MPIRGETQAEDPVSEERSSARQKLTKQVPDQGEAAVGKQILDSFNY